MAKIFFHLPWNNNCYLVIISLFLPWIRIMVKYLSFLWSMFWQNNTVRINTMCPREDGMSTGWNNSATVLGYLVIFNVFTWLLCKPSSFTLCVHIHQHIIRNSINVLWPLLSFVSGLVVHLNKDSNKTLRTVVTGCWQYWLEWGYWLSTC